MSEFKAIDATDTRAELSASRPINGAQRASWHDPAYVVCDDLQANPPVFLAENTTLKDAEEKIEAAHQRYACVTNRDNRVVGIVALREFHGRRAMQLGLQAQMPWYEVTVSALMSPLKTLPQITRRQLEQARIGDAAATLKSKGHDFIVVQDNGTICGVISSLSIAQKTGESVNIYHSASTFAEIMSAVSHSDMLD